MKKISIALILVFFLYNLTRAEENLESYKMFDFAENLFKEKEYSKAITEYKRFIFNHPETPKVIEAKYKLGLCYFMGEKWDTAIKEFQLIANDYPDKEEGKLSLIKLSECYFAKNEYILAINELNNFIEDNASDKRIKNIYFKAGFYSLYDNNIEKAQEKFNKTDNAELKNTPIEFSKLPQKSPIVAGTLSAIIPGAGQFYIKRYSDGIYSFILNGIFIWGAVESFKNDQNVAGGIITFFELGWYSGNIYNAISNAHKFNKRTKIDFLKKLDEKYSSFETN
ncbi:MAG: outer membrane protein assembly factor BamD [Candidatus Firestonebacteria bacterium]|nr:outer membrane protein assembly factor BamD [Candidatus Firestonebacteria bacterium]